MHTFLGHPVWVGGRRCEAGSQARPVVAEPRSIAKRGSPRHELSAACNAVGIKGEPPWYGGNAGSMRQESAAFSRCLPKIDRTELTRFSYLFAV